MAIERDIAFMSLINKAMELNTVSMNETRDSRYNNIGILLFNIQQTLQDGIRENYVDTPLVEVDSSKYKNIPDDDPALQKSNPTPSSSNGTPPISSQTSNDDDEEDEDDDWC